jgi:FimV-like protein
VDFSKASGADAMFVMAGTNVPPGLIVNAGGETFSFCFLSSGPAPVPKAQGDKVVVGKQTVSMGELGIELGVMAEPGESHFREEAMAAYKLLRKSAVDLAKAKALLQAGDKTAAKALLSEIAKHPELPQAQEARTLILDNMSFEEATEGPKDGQKDLGL